MALDLSSLRKAVTALGQTLERCEDDALLARLDEVTRNALRAGAIQHFEFTFELCWKFIQRWKWQRSLSWERYTNQYVGNLVED